MCATASGKLVSRIYSNFRGVDFRGEEINLVRSPDSLNVWKDYKETESIRTRPIMTLHTLFTAKVWGVYFYSINDTDMMIVHSGNSLYKVVDGVKERLTYNVSPQPSQAFIYNNIWYFKDGEHYLQYDGETLQDVVGYVPTTSIGRKPAGGGTIHEDVNIFSPYRINTFVGDGTSTDFYLDSPTIITPQDDGWTTTDQIREHIDEYVYITINGEKYTGGIGIQHTENGIDYIRLTTAPPSPLTDGQDNVSIRFKAKTEAEYRETQKSKILKCTMLQIFDNRVFFSGNPDYPNTLWHCSLNDPTYISDLDYYTEGIDDTPIRSMVVGNNALWVFKEPSQTNTSVFYHTPTIDADYGKIYPNTHSSIATGCIGRAINFNDDIVFFSDKGMEGIVGDVTTEQFSAHRSSMVDRKLIAEPFYKDMILEEWEGYLLVFVRDKVYLADSRGIFTNENHTEYEWFYWDLDRAITCAKVNNGVLYVGTNDGVYTFTYNEPVGNQKIESYWVTPKDKFNYPQYLKTTNKRGCVAEATGDISVSVKTEKTDFELIGTYENVTDYFVSRIKRKKFKDIQLKFHSNTRFSLETATLECFIGGYLKR